MYVEPNGRRLPRDPWSIRRTGVYHKSSAAYSINQVVLLHSNSETIAQARLEGLAESPRKSALTSHPLNIHLLIILSYLVHWPDNIESLAGELEQIVCLALRMVFTLTYV